MSVDEQTGSLLDLISDCWTHEAQRAEVERVILAVAAGSYLAGIPGALFSVPILAVANSSIRYIAGRTWEHESALAAAGSQDILGPGVRRPQPREGARLPGVTSGRSDDAAPGNGSPGSDAGRGTGSAP